MSPHECVRAEFGGAGLMSLYLSRLTLNARHNRTRSELEHPYELHRTLCKAWDDRDEARILYRADQDRPGKVDVIVQSLTRPDWSRLDVPPEYLFEIAGPKTVDLHGLRSGQRLWFRLRCCPSKRVWAKGHEDHGKRKALKAKADIFEWLDRKAEASGCDVIEAAFDQMYWCFSKGGTEACPLSGVVFEGILRVADAEKLRHAVRSGIGPAKAFGFGLLSIAPVR